MTAAADLQMIVTGTARAAAAPAAVDIPGMLALIDDVTAQLDRVRKLLLVLSSVKEKR